MSTVALGNTRCSYLGDNIVRLEHAPDGRFDDRPTFRAITMPPPQAFDAVERDGDVHVLRAGDLQIRLNPSPAGLTRDTLRIDWCSGGLKGQWAPGDVDRANLGGVFTMDHFRRSLLPSGVHPAGDPRVARYAEANVMTTFKQVFASLQADPDAAPGGVARRREWFTDLSLWPEPLRRLADMWMKYPPGLVSRSGYTVLDETGMAFFDPQTRWLDLDLRPDYQNLFFWCYGRDFGRASRQFTTLCGKIPLLPRWALGPWYSCFDKISDAQNRQVVNDFAEHDIPLDVLIIDMDWHINAWDGWDWSDERFPDRDAFFKWKDDADIKVALNVHAETINKDDAHFKRLVERMGWRPGSGSDREEPEGDLANSWKLDYSQRDEWEALRDVCFGPNGELGVDFWWLDHWQGIREGYNSVLWTNHLVAEHTAELKQSRPIILGRYSGLGSHRYPAYFSGDTATHWEVLQAELETNVRAAHVGMSYFSHDLGGFVGHTPGECVGPIDPELYVRWMQMGALAPIMRIHSDHGIREPWKYGEPVLSIVRDAYHLHARLTPYFYHLGREAYDTGLPIHRPLYYLFPEDGRAYDTFDAYFLGSRILIAPVVQPGGRRQIYVPPGDYCGLHDGRAVTGPTTIDRIFRLAENPLFVRAGAIIPMQDVTPRIGTALPDPLVLAVYPGGDDMIELYEDDGASRGYEGDAWSRWPLAAHDDGDAVTVTLTPIAGGFDGLPAQRRVRIELNGVDAPADVAVSGAVGASAWRYDDQSRVASVNLEAVDVRRESRVVIRR